MIRTGAIKVLISKCTTGIYLRWWWNGWHYFLFTNGYEIVMNTESMGTQVTRMFSVISKIERPTRIKSGYSYWITLEGITPGNIGAFVGLLLSEKVEQWLPSGAGGLTTIMTPLTVDSTDYTADTTLLTADMTGIPGYSCITSGTWYEVEITRGEHPIRNEWEDSYVLNFEITRDELPDSSSVYQKSLRLYLGDTLCDMDDDEIVPINKQTNDIAEMQDRQSDFTAQFRIRKTRAMKDLFELSGEVGINTNFPYEVNTCKLIQDNIEMITDGRLILERVDDQYYYVSILSGNHSFFKAIANLKITDLNLNSTNHTWDQIDMEASHTSDLDYIYPLCNPSDDGGIGTRAADTIEFYGGWIWPFVKIKAIWDEIFDNPATGLRWYVEGDILSNSTFLRLFMPIATLELANITAYQYYYSLYRNEHHSYTDALNVLPGGTLILGDAVFAGGVYVAPYSGNYKFKVVLLTSTYLGCPDMYIRILGVDTSMIYNADLSYDFVFTRTCVYELEYTAVAGNSITFIVSPILLYYYSISITDIIVTGIGFTSPVISHRHLPAMSQTEFIKMICNMFGLIPEVTARDRKIRFWNLEELYENIPIARDWSTYLSERDDETEFKFGDYAQSNNLKYKESDDVIKDNGMGIMQIDDETLVKEKDVVELPVSTCDEVNVLTDIEVSRIAFNKYDTKVGLPNDEDNYSSNNSIDPRIVYVDQVIDVSPPIKTLIIRDDPDPVVGVDVNIVCPKKAVSLPVSFSYLIVNYAGLSRLLTKTNLRRAKFNLPVYEVAGLKHYIPIYLSQYKAYFYVNKINNYVPGQLCTIDLIKL